MRILMTGGAGFIGRSLIGHVRGLGHEVVVVDAGFTGRLDEVPDDCRLVERDIASLTDGEWDDLLSGLRDPLSPDLLDGVDIVVNEAAMPA